MSKKKYNPNTFANISVCLIIFATLIVILINFCWAEHVAHPGMNEMCKEMGYTQLTDIKQDWKEYPRKAYAIECDKKVIPCYSFIYEERCVKRSKWGDCVKKEQYAVKHDPYNFCGG